MWTGSGQEERNRIMKFKVYEHKTQYYETDQMGIIHHANYLHWFEEGRIDMLEQMGMGYDVMESRGIISPVLSVHCEYKSMARFGETVQILVHLKEYNGIRMTLEYTILDKATGQLRCVGESRHCFLTRDGKPVSLTRHYIEMDRAFQEYKEHEEELKNRKRDNR